METLPKLQFDRKSRHFTHDGAPIALSREDVLRMNSLRWWHEIPFGPEVKTPAHHSPLGLGLVEKFHIDQFDFRGKTVLDIGVNDGFYSFWAEAHGAQRCVGIDDLSQLLTGVSSQQFAREKLCSRLEFFNMSLYDLSPKVFGGFDAVMMFGVLYHLVHPMLGLERACSVCKNDFFLETYFVNDDSPIPLCTLYPERECADDYSNWSGPNLAWIVRALEIQGFQARSITAVNQERVAVHATRVRNIHTESSILNAHRDTTFFHLGPKV